MEKIAKDRESYVQRYLWTAIYVIIGILVGVSLVSFFAYHEKLNAFILLLWSLAYMVIGALIGFIFSVPKIISDNPHTSAVKMESLTSTEKKRIEDNTNLTQISDWLTKILIGAGLVQIKDAPGFVLHVAKVMAQGIRKVPVEMNTMDSATIMCAAIILYFITWGFISGYLVMKLVLAGEFVESSTE